MTFSFKKCLFLRESLANIHVIRFQNWFWSISFTAKRRELKLGEGHKHVH